MATRNKRILDSVHGYIKMREALFRNVVDTPNFQRLRHIEQTSARSIFPSARHDRFIHSLGVFHIGQKMIEAIEKTNECKCFPNNKTLIYNCFRAACLLHDVGHSPFSHTFEQYYENKACCLMQLLKDEIKNDNFSRDADRYINNSAPHEIMSAYVVIKAYSKQVKGYRVNLELIVRMIIGCFYGEEAKTHSFENAFIQLIHGNVIDADGLDYVCRDAWASGYSAARVDIERLIESIVIIKDTEDLFQVCYTPKALNEIEAALSVKTFQQTNVITHHTVVYEQHLLVKAMESAALYHFKMQETDDESCREDALGLLCDVNTMYKTINLPKHAIPLIYPMDDDFVSLMKYIPDNKYVRQWFSRQYELIPLWKSKADFYNAFPMFIEAKITRHNWLFSDDCKEFIAQYLEVPIFEIWILDAQDKYKGHNASTINMLVNNQIKRYIDLFPNDKNSFKPDIQPFYYIYIPKSKKNRRLEVIGALKEEISRYIFNRVN